MKEEMNNSVYTGDTEEIILDMDEFETLLSSKEMSEINEKEFETNQDFYEEEVSDEYDDNTVLYSKAELEEEIVSHVPNKYSSKRDNDIDLYDEDEEPEVASFFGDKIADKMLYLVGGLIILFGIIVGAVALTGRTRIEVSSPDMSEIGLQMSNIGVIGESGITSVFGKKAADLDALETAAEELGYDEIDEETGLVNVTLSLTSILKDLKIKFVNKNNKLVANVPFEVEVTGKDGKTEKYTDDNKDGIIYLSGLNGGKYTVKMTELDAYTALYAFNTESSEIEVKSQIEYKKVDVSNEIKSDANTDAKNEDTRQQQTETEGTMKDTVEFVVSTKTAINGEGYVELSKSSIPDPKAAYTDKDTAKTSTFRKLDVSDGEGEENPPEEVDSKITGFSGNPSEMKPGETADVSVATNDSDNILSVSWNTSDSAISIAENNLNVKLTANDVTQDTSVTISCTVYFANGKSSSDSFNVTVKNQDASSFQYSVSVPSMTPESTYDLSTTATCVVKDKTGATITSGYTLSYESSNSKIVSVEGSVLTAVKQGTATITVTCTLTDGKKMKASFDVTVNESNVKVKLNYSKRTIFLGGSGSYSLTATVTGFATSNSVKWTSSNEGVVKVGKDGSLTPVAEGSATITCASEEAPKAKAECAITVVISPEKNTVSLLKDKDGNQVYVYDSTTKKYREAKYADYYTAGTFYTPGSVSYKYTGWWTLNGKTYYFNKNGEKVTGEQVILGTKYVFGADGALSSGAGTFGIDVSKWNGTIDWSKVASSGVSYAIIRSGFRGSTKGDLYADSKFDTNMKNATANGIKVGVYFFTQATSEVEAVEEASMVLEQVSKYKVTYPIFIDVESAGAGARAEGLTNAQRTAAIKAFCKTISNGGYTAGVYANKTWFTSKINTSDLLSYKIWLAQYNSTVTYSASRYDLWQYSDKGSIGGINGNVDLDRSYMGY